MANVIATNSESFHLWALPTDSAREISPSLEFNEIRNDLGNGYRTQVLYGSDTGTRSWSVSLPTLAGIDTPVPTVTGVNGETVSREQYVWDLYNETRITGKPFVFTCPRDGQYYLVDFVNKRLRFDKQFRQKLYSTGIELMQVREAGVSVFSPLLMSSLNRYNFDWLDQQGHSTDWNNNAQAANLVDTGDVVFSSATQNSKYVVRFNNSASTGYVQNATGSWATPIKEIWIVMKMREAAFSNNAGVFTGSSSNPILVGTSAGTKFQNPSITGLEYFLNGTEYAVTDMQAPMNAWGIVQCRFTSTGVTPSTLVQFGRDRANAGTYAKMDVAEIVSSSELIPQSDSRQLHEYLTIKWDL